MVIDPADYDDTMQLPGGPQEKFAEGFGLLSSSTTVVFRDFARKYLVMWSTTLGELK